MAEKRKERIRFKKGLKKISYKSVTIDLCLRYNNTQTTKNTLFTAFLKKNFF
jgi:hypothetical protein